MTENNNDVIGFIASTVETLRDDVATMRKQMATKDDLAQLDGRLSERIDQLDGRLDQMATKDDLAGRLGERIDQLDHHLSVELDGFREQMATKEDLARLHGRFTERLDASTTSIRGDLEQVQLRLDSIEHNMSSRFQHVEGELSRLRSAVYILGKDRPEVLRLLGQSGG
jgi:hypothetical protein